MSAPTAPAMPATKIPRTWLGLLLAGMAVVVAGAVLGFVAVRGAFTSPVLSTPGTISEHARAGEYLLFAQSGTQHGGLGFTTSDTFDPQLRASAFTVTEDGATLPLADDTSRVSQTERRGSRIFLAVATVHVPHSGRLTLTADDDEGAVILSPSIGGSFVRTLPGVVISLLGVALVVVALVVRTRAARKVKPQWRLGPDGYAYRPPGWTPPTGWVPPPTAAPWPPPPAMPASYPPPSDPSRQPPRG